MNERHKDDGLPGIDCKAEPQAEARGELADAILGCVPDSWLDPLLTGPEAVIHNVRSGLEIEALLNGIKKRLRALLAARPAPTAEKALREALFKIIDGYHDNGRFRWMLRADQRDQIMTEIDTLLAHEAPEDK